MLVASSPTRLRVATVVVALVLFVPTMSAFLPLAEASHRSGNAPPVGGSVDYAVVNMSIAKDSPVFLPSGTVAVWANITNNGGPGTRSVPIIAFATHPYVTPSGTTQTNVTSQHCTTISLAPGQTSAIQFNLRLDSARMHSNPDVDATEEIQIKALHQIHLYVNDKPSATIGNRLTDNCRTLYNADNLENEGSLVGGTDW